MQIGESAIVSMLGNRVGRIGEIIKMAVNDDEWDPLVPKSKELPIGEMGRRVFVRWDLITGPTDFDLIVKLPEHVRFTKGELRPTVAEIRSHSIDDLKEAMNDSSNWVGLFRRFAYEQALSDYIASYPHRLEEGLMPYPNSIVREKVFPDKSRLDVLLVDGSNTPVVVECKQHSPSTEDVKQLQKYMNHVSRETGKPSRGILVHGGTPRLQKGVSNYLQQNDDIEVVSYKLDIDFAKAR
jgi:hypothetical protein